MPDWLMYLLAVVAIALLLFVGGLLALLFILKPKGVSLRDGLKVIPDVVRLVRRLTKERGIGGAIKVGLILLFLYLVSPVDVIPDFIPVVGSVDDIILFIAVLREVLNRAGPDMLRRQWPGSPSGLEVMQRLLRLKNRSNQFPA